MRIFPENFLAQQQHQHAHIITEHTLLDTILSPMSSGRFALSASRSWWWRSATTLTRTYAGSCHNKFPPRPTIRLWPMTGYAIRNCTQSILSGIIGEAYECVKKSNFSEALEKLEVAIATDPENRNKDLMRKVWAIKGSVLGLMNRGDDALVALDKANDLIPHADVYETAAYMHGLAGRYDKAVHACDRSLELKPEQPKVWSMKGEYLVGMKRLEDALIPIDRALEMDPTMSQTWVLRGVVLHDLKFFDDAIASFRKVIEISPRRALAWHHLGMCLTTKGDLEAAVSHYGEAEIVFPDDASFRSRKGGILCTMTRYSEAVISLERSIQLDPKIDIMILLGTVHSQLHQYDNAERVMDKALTMEPLHTVALSGKAMLMLLKRRFAEAVQLLDAAIAVLPNDIRIIPLWTLKADAHLQLGQESLALTAAQNAIDLDPCSVAAWRVKIKTLFKFNRQIECMNALVAARTYIPDIESRL